MRSLIVVVIVIVVVAAGVWFYLAQTTPREAAGVSFPLSASDVKLLSNVPPAADSFALIPTAAAVMTKAESNPVAHDAIEQWRSSHPLPQPWMLGRADIVAWRVEKTTNYAIAVDPVRAVVLRTYLTLASSGSSNAVLINPPLVPQQTQESEAVFRLGGGLPRGDILVVQRGEGRGAFPPIGRPSVSSVSVDRGGIAITSHAPRDVNAPQALPLHPRYARGAILTAAFAAPPRLVEEMNRLVGAKASTLLRDGGTVVLYDVDTRKLLPRLREVIVLPATDEKRAALRDFVDNVTSRDLREIAGFQVQTADTGKDLLVAFDRDSIQKYQSDTFDPASIPSSLWSLHVVPQRAVPVLQQIADSPGLRYLTPRLFRSAQDLSAWIEHLQKARVIEAADSAVGDVEELRVKISD